MRLFLPIVILAVNFSLAPQSALAGSFQFQRAFNFCESIRNDGVRLKCFDVLPRQADFGRSDSAEWRVAEGKSKIDGSPTVYAVLPSADMLMSLTLLCQDRRIEAVLHRVQGRPIEAPVKLRLSHDGGKPKEVVWPQSSDGLTISAPDASQFIAELSGRKNLSARASDLVEFSGEFNLTNFKAVKETMSKSCEGSERPQ